MLQLIHGCRVLFLVLLMGAVSLPAAHALRTSENAFRLEDSREGNVLLGADEAVIEAGEIYGTVVLLWGNLDIHGRVDEVVILSGKVTFHPESRLNKTLAVMGGSFESKPGAEVPPENVMYRAPGPLWRILQSGANLWKEHINWMIRVAGAVLSCFLLWISGLLLFRFFPALQGITEGRLMSQWPQNLLAGLLGTMVVPVFLALLVISILGIFLVPLYFIFLFLAALISYLAAALWAGHRLLPVRPGEKLNPWGFLLGLMALQLLWAVSTWWASLPVLFLWTLGWGALLRGARVLWR